MNGSAKARAEARSAAVRRLKRATGAVTVGAAALAAFFTAIAARSVTGHAQATRTVTTTPTTTTPATTKVPAPPALPDQPTQSPAPLAAGSAPAPTQQAPVAVSGGS